MTTINAVQSLDRRGKSITTFVAYDAALALAALEEGEILEVLTDDFAPFVSDFETWCAAVGHRLVAAQREDGGLRLLIEKGPPKSQESSMAMVVSDAGLLELLSPLGFALGAALEGAAVHLYFQGPAVRVLTRSFRPRLQGWSRPFTRFAASGLRRSGHVSAREKLLQLQSLGAEIYACGPSMVRFKAREDEFFLEDVHVVEYLTFAAVMHEADVQLYV